MRFTSLRNTQQKARQLKHGEDGRWHGTVGGQTEADHAAKQDKEYGCRETSLEVTSLG